MHRIWREGARVGLAVLASTSLALGPGLAGAQSQSGSDQTSSESKPPGQGGAEATKNGHKAKSGSGQTAGNVGDRLHDSAKGFGEAILGGIKYAGRKIIGFFND